MRRFLAAFVCVFVAGGAVWAQHEGSHKDEKKAEAAMPEDMQKMMEAWAKYASPGEHHAVLDAMAGDWKIDGKFRMSPEGEWMDSPSEARIEWVLGGRFLRQSVTSPPSPMMPQPFEGIGYLGYDNGAQRYVSSWMDTMSTVLVSAAGPGEGGKIALKGSYFDPVSGADKSFKWVYSIESKDEFTLTMHEPGPDGEMFVNAKLTYHRRGE